MKTFRRKHIYSILAGTIIALAIIITLLRIGLFLLNQNPSLLTQRLSQSLGKTVHIGGLHAQLHYFQPEILLDNVVIFDQTGQHILSFKQGLVRLNILPLVTTGKIQPTLLAADHAQLSLQKDQQGKIMLVGFGGDGDFFSSMIKSGSYYLMNSEISWSDQNNSEISAQIHQLNLGLESTANHSRLSVNAFISEQRSKIQLIANLTRDDSPVQSYTGDFYINSPSIQLADLRTLTPIDFPVENNQFTFNFWGHIKHSELSALNGTFNIDRIEWATDLLSTKSLSNLPEHLHSTIWMERNTENWQLLLDHIDTGHVSIFEDQQLAIDYRPASHKNQNPGYELHLSKLQLDNLIPLIKKLPEQFKIPESLAKHLQTTTIQGYLQNFQLVYQNRDNTPVWSVCTGFQQLQFNSPDIVTLNGFWSGDLCANQQQAELTLHARKASVLVHDLYTKPVSLTLFNGKMNWKNTVDGWILATDDLKVTTDDLSLDLKLGLQAHPQTPWSLDTTVDFELLHAENLKHYLPTKQLAGDVYQWLENVFHAGALKNGKFHYQGLLVDTPFRNKAATATAYVELENMQIQFDPDQQWPQLRHFNADLHFKNGLATMNVASGNSLGVKIRSGTIIVKDLSALDNVVISTQLQTPLLLAENYILNSPLESMIGDFVHYLQPRGKSTYNLEFMVPLHSETDQFWINGTVDLPDATLKLSEIDLTINHLKGLIQFTEETVTAEKIEALVDNQPLQIDINDSPESINIKATTHLEDQFLHQRWPWLTALQGSANTTVKIEVGKNSPPETTDVVVKIRSDLQGMQVGLPAPLYKTTNERTDLAVNINLRHAHRMPIDVYYGKNTHAELLLLEQTLDQWEFDSAHLMIGKGHLPLNNTTKYSLKAHLHEWDLQELQTIQTFISELHFEQPQSTENNAQSADLTIDIDIDQLTLAETRLGSVSLALKKRNPDWYGKIGGSVATGTFSYIPGTESDTKNLTPHRGEINLNLETFNVVDTSSLTKAQTSITNDDSLAFLPDQFPAMIITVDQLVWDDFDMGKLFLETSTIENGLLIDTFTINSTQHQFSASGQWVTHESMMETHLKGMLQSKNMGHILNKFGIYEDIRKTAAKIDFNLGWQASPFLIDWQSLGGKISFKLKHGRLLGVEPGIGRALGLFSLSAWERRLRFDFSDVVNKGFAYDNVDVEFALFNGNAYSANFKIDGVAARVNFAGRIGLLAKDIDAVVTVIPRSSIALPLVGAAGGPIGIGAGLVMQQVIGNQFETLSSSEYTITGQWTNPKITLVPENGGIFTRMLWELQKITGIQDSTAQ